MRKLNIAELEMQYDEDDPEGYSVGYNRFGPSIEAVRLGATVYELPPGQSVCPYHYEYVEEWLLVLDGDVVLRTPEGEQGLVRGDLVCFAPGPSGAHKVSNRSEQTARVLMFSSAREPSVAVYPDSDKIGVWPGNDDDRVMLRRADGHVDYYDGER